MGFGGAAGATSTSVTVAAVPPRANVLLVSLFPLLVGAYPVPDARIADVHLPQEVLFDALRSVVLNAERSTHLAHLEEESRRQYSGSSI